MQRAVVQFAQHEESASRQRLVRSTGIDGVDEQGEMIIVLVPADPEDGLDCGSHTCEQARLNTEANQPVEHSRCLGKV
jgi:hypothetical protein